MYKHERQKKLRVEVERVEESGICLGVQLESSVFQV